MGENADLRKKYTDRLSQLTVERSTWLEHWRELSENILPRAYRFKKTDRNRGTKRNEKIINNTATRANRIISSGMHAGITSPSRPWFRVGTDDPNLSEVADVRAWLHVVEEAIRQVFARSNIYNVLPTLYSHLATFGTCPVVLDEDDEEVLRGYVIPPGQYCLIVDEKQRVCGMIREFGMKVGQLVERFGKENCSRTVQASYDQKQLEQWVEVVHVVDKNSKVDPMYGDFRGKPFLSIWFEQSTENPERFLRKSGYFENPLVCPRWDIVGEDVYGHSPAMDALGDIKALYVLEKDKAKLSNKLVDPPMVGPSSLKNQRVSLLPGDVTYVDSSGAGAKFEPAMQVNPAGITVVREAINDHAQRINETFMVDLWLMLADSDRRQITAREVDERHEEKMLQLGPVLERLHDELLSPLIDRCFGILLRRGQIPKPPQQLQGKELKVEYISIAAQAQKLLSTSGVERLTSFAGNLAAVKPEVLDKLDFDEIIDEYSNLLGTKPALVRSDDDVAQIRQQRAQAQAQQAAQQQAMNAADGAKTLSQADMGGDNALTRLMGALGQGAPSVGQA